MTDNRRTGARQQTGSVPTPGRVQDAARAMNYSRTSSGYQRGFVPPNAAGSGRNPQYTAPYAAQPVQYSSMNGGTRGFSSGSGSGKKPGGKKTGLIILAVICLIGAGIGLYFGGNYLINVKPVEDNIRNTVAYYQNIFTPGVSVDGIELDGMTVEQATSMVQSQIQQKYYDWHVDLTYQGVTKSISAGDLGIDVDIAGALSAAWETGHNTTGTRTDREMYEDIGQAVAEPRSYYSVKSTGDLSRIDTIIDTIAQSLYVAPQDAYLVRFDPYDTSLSDPFIYQDEVYGQQVNTEDLRNRLYHMAQNLQSGTIEIPTEPVYPEVTKQTLKLNYSLLSQSTTPIATSSSEERNYNIGVAMDRINGYILQPDQTFSFNKIVGDRTTKNGFREAIEYAYGEHVMGIGGGVCQASTTVYQAAVEANLKILQRKPHSDSVSYAGYGMDATVNTNGKKVDLTFKNTTGAPVYFIARVIPDRNNKKRQSTLVQIYGKYMGDVYYKLEAELVETLYPDPFEIKTVKDQDGTYVKYTDQEKLVKAKEGYIYKSYRVKYVNGVFDSREFLFTDRYEPQPQKRYVGVVER